MEKQIMIYNKVKMEIVFGLKEASGTIFDDEEVVATIIVNQDPDALKLIKKLVNFMTAEEET